MPNRCSALLSPSPPSCPVRLIARRGAWDKPTSRKSVFRRRQAEFFRTLPCCQSSLVSLGPSSSLPLSRAGRVAGAGRAALRRKLRPPPTPSTGPCAAPALRGFCVLRQHYPVWVARRLRDVNIAVRAQCLSVSLFRCRCPPRRCCSAAPDAAAAAAAVHCH